MENFVLSLEIVLPLFIVMAVGYACKRLNLITEDLAKKMNGLVFRVFLPVLLCKNIYTSSLESLADPTVFIFAGVGIVLMFLALMYIIPRMEKDERKCGAIIQAAFRSNYAYFGIPLVQAIFPGSDTSIASLLVVVVVSILVNSVVLLDNSFARMGAHLLLLPIVVGISYEINRWCGRHDNWLSAILSAPGKWLQHITTYEPDDGMIEVAIRAMELVIPEEKGSDAWGS